MQLYTGSGLVLGFFLEERTKKKNLIKRLSSYNEKNNRSFFLQIAQLYEQVPSGCGHGRSNWTRPSSLLQLPALFIRVSPEHSGTERSAGAGLVRQVNYSPDGLYMQQNMATILNRWAWKENVQLLYEIV